MNSTVITVIGFCAAALTTFSFVPQFLKIISTKKTDGISLLMILQISLGLFLWVIYGLLRKDIVLIIANGVGFVIIIATLFVYLIYSKERD